jgi:uncharacterized SAM-binding protein YcdF (DUF218 family)
LNRISWKIFIVGLAAVFILVLLVTTSPGTAQWLVIDSKPQNADIAIVLGGGGGSRLRQALNLYDQQLVDELLLVDFKEKYWEHITRYLCPDCILADKKVTILSGSNSTKTDAQFSLEYCKKQGIKKVLVVTDPYHTRRSALTFSWVFRESDITVDVVSSGDYGKCLSPENYWWIDITTLKTVWLELGKCFVVLCTQYLPGFDTA